MEGNIQEIQALMKQFEDSEMRELKIDSQDFHLYLSKNKVKPAAQSSQSVEIVDEKKPSLSHLTENKTNGETKKPVTEDLTVVKSPLVGIVYLQAKPGQPAFVKAGQHVKKGDTICIIEAMKMMTEVKSTASGIVKEINVENEDLVEVDQPLISVEKD